MLGRPAEEFIGRNMHDAVHGLRADGSLYPQDECPIYQMIGTPASPRSVTNDVFWRRDGTPMPVDYSAAPIIDEGVAVGAVVAFTDISARRKLEPKLEQANRLTSLGRMAATIAHEFNNVLMGISPYVELLRRKPEEIAKAIDQISRAVSRGKGITHDILRYTQPAEPNRAVVAVEPWLRNVVMEARSMLPPIYAIDLDVDDPPLSIEADANQLHQILMNLVLNARDAMWSGAGRSAFRCAANAHGTFCIRSGRASPALAHLIVRDEGSGMKPETLRHMFEPLFTTKKNGTGLGLAVTHQVVLRHGGEIFVESEIGVGTTFHIFLPLAETTAAVMSSMEPAGELANDFDDLGPSPSDALFCT